MKRYTTPGLFTGQLSEIDNFSTNTGIFYYSTDTGDLYIKEGTSLINVTDSGGYSVPLVALSTIASPITGQQILDTEDLNIFKYYDGSQWKTTDSGFDLATGDSGTVNETKDVKRSGKTSFGGDDPVRQVEVIGDFKLADTIVGNGSISAESGDGVLTSLGHTTEFTGHSNTYILEGTGEYSASFNGLINITTVFDLLSMHGVGKGGSLLSPTDYARMVAFRANPATNGGNDHLVLDLETKNGAFASKLRVRAARLEYSDPVRFTALGLGNLQEGDTYDGEAVIGTTTIGAPVYNISVDAVGNLMETPLETLAGAINMPDLPTHADEAAAITAALTTGDLYQTATGELRIKL
tara:strand:+ start:6818 stop:7873 length:1056 start_codon:yes stop_codon:yes gene_type:complete